MARKRAVLCDIDGVLLDSVPAALKIVQRILEARGEQWTKARELEFRKIAGFRLTEYFTVLFPNYSFTQALAQWRPVQQSVIPGIIPSFSFSEKTVRSLKEANLAVALVTNREAENFREHAGTSCPWLERADAIQTLGKRKPKLHRTHVVTRWAKPDPRSLLPILQWLEGRGFRQCEMVFVGDSLADLVAAHGNHITFVGVLTGTVDTIEHWIAWAREHDIMLPAQNIIATIRDFSKWLDNI